MTIPELKQKNWKEAVVVLSRMHASNPDEASVQRGLAYALAQLGLAEEALEHLDQLLSRASEPTDAAPSHLMRALLLRRLGQKQESLQDFLAVEPHRELTFEETLVYTETLLNVGQELTAIDMLNRCSQIDDPRRLLLEAIANQNLGQPSRALQQLREVGYEGVLGLQSAQRTIVIFGLHPELDNGLAVFDLLPPRRQTDLYWLVRGNAYLHRGDARRVLESWLRVRNPSPQVVDKRTSVALAWLETLFAAREDATIRNLGTTLLHEIDSDAIRRRLEDSLAREILHADPERAEKLLSALAERDATASSTWGSRSSVLRSLLHALRGDLEQARESLKAIPTDDVLAPHVGSLVGWVQLKSAFAKFEQQDLEGGLADLESARTTWPTLDRELSAESEELAPTLGEHQLSDRERTRAALDAHAAEAGLAESRTCHNLGLFHLVEGHRCAQAGDEDAVLSHWRLAIAHLAIPLTDFAYIREWAHGRGEVYQATPSSEAIVGIEHGMIRYCETLFGGWESRSRNEGKTAFADRLAELPILLQAELSAARELRDQRGLRMGDASPVFAGPLYLEEKGLLDAFGQFLDERQTVSSPSSRMKLERLFSPFRVGVVLEQQRRFEEAAECVQRVLEGDTTLGEKFGDLARDFQIDLFVRQGEAKVMTASEPIAAGVACWQSAYALAKETSRAESVGRSIWAFVLGRARALDESQRYAVGIELIESVREFLANEEADGMLSNLLSKRGIQLGRSGDWEEAVAALRRAHGLRPQIVFPGSNFVQAVRCLVEEIWYDDEPRAVALLREAREACDTCLSHLPGNAELMELRKEVLNDLAALDDGEARDLHGA